MPGADDIQTRLVATDDASAVIDRVADKAEALEKLNPTVEIDADEAKAETAIRSIAERVENLTDKQKDIVLKATVAQAEDDIKRLERSLRGFQTMSDDEVQIRLTALDRATDDLEAARRLRDELSAKAAEVTIEADDRASGDLDRVGDRARQLDSTEVDINVGATGIDSVLGKLGELQGLGGQLAGGLQGLSAGGGVATGAAAIATALGAAALHQADIALSAQSLATLTGDTVEDASRLQQVWQQSGADVQDLADVALQVQGALAQSPELAEQLGVDLQDGATGGQRLAQVLERVRNFTGSAADKAQLMSAVFGEEGARQAATLLAIVEDIPKALDDVDDDLVISEEQVDQARELKLAVNEAVSEFRALAAEIGSAVIPAASELLGIVNDIAGIEIAGTGIFDAGGYNAFKSIIEGDDITPKFDTSFVDKYRSALDGVSTSTDIAEGKTRELELAQKDAERATAAHQYALDALYGRLNDSTALLNLQGQFDTTQTKVEEAFSAWSSGAEDAEQKVREADLAQQDLKRSVADYATQVLGLPTEVVTDLLAQIDQGKAAEVEAFLTELGKTRNVYFKPVVTGGNTRAFMAGTYDAPGGMALVGEAGPEFVFLPGGSAVSTAGETRRALQFGNNGSGGTTNIYYPPGMGNREFARRQRSSRQRGFGRAR